MPRKKGKKRGLAESTKGSRKQKVTSPPRSEEPPLSHSTKWRRWWIAAAALVGLIACTWLLFTDFKVSGELELDHGSPPNVLLISVDTLRADYLGAYGGAVPTPSFDALAKEGVLFEKTVSHAPITLPSHASILTGSYPIAHGVRDNGSFRLDASQNSLAEVFQASGYRTAAFVGSFALDSRFGLDQGFDVYDDDYGDTSELGEFHVSERAAEAVLDSAQAWLDELNDERWFVFIHLFDPHFPYAPPPPFGREYADDPYAGEVAYVDSALGHFLDELRKAGKLSNVLIVATADHGEGLGEHGEKTHAMFAYDSTLHVPLILNWQSFLPEGVRVPSRVRLIDLAPTVAELAGLEAPQGCQGRSLIPIVTGVEKPEDRDSYFEAMTFHLNRDLAPLTGLYHGPHKYIDLPIPELYDLGADPQESDNLFEIQPEFGRQAASVLDQLITSHSTEVTGEIRTAELDRETVARMESLGYLVAPRRRGKSREYTQEDDPKRLLHLADRMDEGMAAQRSGHTDEAIRLFRAVLSERPSYGSAYAYLADVFYEVGRLDQAIAALQEAQEKGAQTVTTRSKLGAYLQEAGRLEESVSVLESLIEDNPSHAEAHNYLGISYARLGRPDKAIEALEKLVELDSSSANAYSNMGSAYVELERFQQAERHFLQALEINPRLAFAWNGLGVTHDQARRPEEAIRAWKRAVELDRRQYEALYSLGVILTELERPAEAIGYLEQFLASTPLNRYRQERENVRWLVNELKTKPGPAN